MKRDMELVRRILFAIEAVPFDGEPMWPNLAGYEDEEVTYHIMIMHEAGLIYATDNSTNQEYDWRPVYITWAGHEFLGLASEESNWSKALTTTKEKAGGVVFSILTEVLGQIVKSQMGLP